MKQYLDLCRRIVNEGEWVANERTGKRCLTVINADLEYDVANNQFPLITTRKSYWKAAIAEFLGYMVCKAEHGVSLMVKPLISYAKLLII